MEVEDFDHDKARQLAQLIEEEEALNKRLDFLWSIKKSHSKLNKYLWRTFDGRVMLIHDMDDNHLKNAIIYLMKKGRKISPVLRAEYNKRFGEGLPKVERDEGEGYALSDGDLF